MTKAGPASPTDAKRSLSLRLLLPALLGLLVAGAFVPVASLSFWAVRDNTGRLMRDGQEGLLEALTARIATPLDQVAAQMEHARAAVDFGIADPDDPEGFPRFVFGLMAATPQVVGIGFLTESGPFLRYERDSFRVVREARTQAPLADEIWRDALAGERGWWGPPFVSLIIKQPTTLFFQPARRDGKLLGVFMVAIANVDVAAFVARSAELAGIEPFVLVGRERVLVHRNLGDFDPRRADLPRIDEIGDRVLARIWTDMRERTVQYELVGAGSHWTYVGDAAYGYVYREIAGYGDEPWIAGFHEPSARSFRARFVVTALFWTIPVLLLGAVLAAWHLGRIMSARARAIAGHVGALERLEPPDSGLARLASSGVTEERETAAALARAAVALSRFGAYVPRALVRRLMVLGPEAAKPTTREVSVLFLDLEGYTAFSEGRPAEDVAAYLNGVFGLVGPAIERHDGTIDKFTGDGLLAVWGVPLPDAAHAAKALAAAREIARVIAAEYARAPICRVRIGLHTGPVLAGDLGFEGRINYTVVGGTVNVAQRAQAALRGRHAGGAVTIGATDAMLAACPGIRAELMPDAEAGGHSVHRIVD